MDAKTIKWAIGMIYLGIIVAMLILIVDMKLKNDIVEGLKNAEGKVGENRWSYTNNSHSVLPGNGNLRFATRMEEKPVDSDLEAELFPEESEDESA